MGVLLGAEIFLAKAPRKTRGANVKRTDYSEVCGSLRSESQWLQRSGFGPFKEPAGADAQTVMPRWQPRRVHRETRLPGEGPSHHFAGRQHRRVLRAQTESFA